MIYAKIFLYKIKIGFKYKFNFIIDCLFSFLYIALYASIWTALYQKDYSTTFNGITLGNMLLYSVLSNLCGAFIETDVMENLCEAVLDGSITNYLLWPVSFRKHLYYTSITDSLYRIIQAHILPSIAAVIIFQINMNFNFAQLLLFLFSLFLGQIINFLYKYIMGLSSIWLENSFFINNLDGLFIGLFAGEFIPLWFFPTWLQKISYVLPFRFTLFEPLSILLLDMNALQVVFILSMQLLWVVILFSLGSIMWFKGKKKLSLYGG